MGAFHSATDCEYLARNHDLTLVYSNGEIVAKARVPAPCGLLTALVPAQVTVPILPYMDVTRIQTPPVSYPAYVMHTQGALTAFDQMLDDDYSGLQP